MTSIEITNIIKGVLNHIQPGASLENPKLDFKAKWYDLKDEEQINEFLKDSSAIANTPGLDGFIVIGYDEKANVYSPSVFKDCKLKDENELTNLLIKRLDRNFRIANYDIIIDRHPLSVLHIPPSFDKPHVIRNYIKNGKPTEHRVFIRHGSTTRVATKYDHDFMAYDRKNNIPEYSVFISASRLSFSPHLGPTKTVDMSVGLIIENNGIRPVAIKHIKLNFAYKDLIRTFISKTNKEEQVNSNIAVSNIIVQAGTIKNLPGLQFNAEKSMTQSEFEEYQRSYTQFDTLGAEIRLNNGRVFQIKVEIE